MATLACVLVSSCSGADSDSSEVSAGLLSRAAPGQPWNVEVAVLNNGTKPVAMTVTLNGQVAIQDQFPSQGTGIGPGPAVYRYNLPAGTLDIRAHSQDHDAETKATVGGLRRWIVIQDYDSDELGLRIDAYEHRPQFG